MPILLFPNCGQPSAPSPLCGVVFVYFCVYGLLSHWRMTYHILSFTVGGSYPNSHDTFWTNSNDFPRLPAFHFSLLIFFMNTDADVSFMLSSSVKATEWELLSVVVVQCWSWLILVICQIPVWLCCLILVYSVGIDDARSQTQHIWDREMKIFNQQSYVSPKNSFSQIETQT